MKTVFTLITILLCINTAFALKVQSGNDITISKPVYEDYYITGGTVTINAPIHGDLIVGGGTVVINDTITNDVMVGAGKVTIYGFVGDDVRGIVGEIHIKGIIVGDLILTGGKLTIEKTSMIYGDVLIGGGTVNMSGTLKGSLKGMSGTLIMDGIIEQDIDYRGSDVTVDGVVRGKSILSADRIDIGSSAAFYQDVRYWNRSHALDFKKSIKNGKALFESSLEISNGKWQYLGFASILGLVWYLIVVLIFIALAQYLFSNLMGKAAEYAFGHALKSIGYGLLFLVGVPVGILVLMITIVGIPIGFMLLVFYIILVSLANVVCSVVIANRISVLGNYKWSNLKLSSIALFIFILLKMVAQIPIAGLFIMIIITSLVFGSILLTIKWKRNKTIEMG
ncbi:MAG: hypothetical protein WC756_19320 [Taibaiella sp.]